jgi:hypothetical protein
VSAQKSAAYIAEPIRSNHGPQAASPLNAVTGLSLQSVRAILDMHYLARDPALSESAIRKLERGTNSPN